MKERAFVQMVNGRYIKATIDGVHVMEEEKIRDLFRYEKIILDERKEEGGKHYRNVGFGKQKKSI